MYIGAKPVRRIAATAAALRTTGRGDGKVGGDKGDGLAPEDLFYIAIAM